MSPLDGIFWAGDNMLMEEVVLAKALDHTHDEIATVRAYREVKHARLERAVEEARVVAKRRSGVRGLKARKALIGLEEELVISRER